MVSSSATTVQQYINELESEKAKVIKYVRKLILENLPKGIQETMDWGMINYEIPLSTYPKTYNKKPLSVMSLACLLYTSPSPRDVEESRMPSSA